MRGLLIVVLASVVLAGACDRGTRVTYKEPPAASYSVGVYQVQIGEAAIAVPGAEVSSDFFYLAEVQPLLGRFFVNADSSKAATGVVALSHEFWNERFGASPDIIGRTIEVNGRSMTIVGIAPPGFTSPKGARVWMRKRNGPGTGRW